MMNTRHMVAIAALFALTSIDGMVAAQQRPDRIGTQNAPSRSSDRQVQQLLTRTKKGADTFRASLDRAIDRSSLKGSRDERDANQAAEDFAEATNHLSDHFGRRQIVTSDVEEVLRRGVNIDTFMQRHDLATQAENDWRTVRRDLDELARVYNVAWNWSNPRYTAAGQEPAVYQRLTGTYQLERSRSDDPGQAVERATRRLPSNQRQGAHQRLIARLNAPDTIAIDRDGRSVTIASSSGEQVTFEADGQPQAEQGPAGRSVDSRATLYGDQLVVTTTGAGNRGNDFAVTFEPIDDGRSLQVTRRIYDNSLRQPVSVQSFYRRSSEQAEWDNVSATRRASNRPGARSNTAAADLGVPAGTRLVGTLDNALSTRDARVEDRFSITVSSPSQYAGAVIDGTVSSVNPSGRVSGRSDLALSFERIRMRGGRTSPFSGVIDGMRTADGDTIRVDSEGTAEGDSQTGRTVQRGAIGAGIGAIIGAITGGGQGAAVGAAIGAGGGAGTVVVQGRDHLELARGTELTITAGTY